MQRVSVLLVVSCCAVAFTFRVDAASTEDYETGDFSAFPWVHSGNADWAITTVEKHGGTYAAKAGTIAHSQNSTLEVTLDCEAGNVSFWRKVSSEADYDLLKFYIDGGEEGSWSGMQAWAEERYSVTEGEHTFRWTYSKDADLSGGSDTAWIDDITFPAVPPAPEIDVQRPAGFSIVDGDIDELGTVPVGTVALSYTIDNSAGTNQLTIPFAGVTAADLTNCSSFSVGTTLPLAVAAGGSGTLDISFHVDTASSFSLELDIGSNDSDENPYDIRIEGAGTPTPTPEVDGSGTDDVLEITATSQDSGSYVLTTDGVPGPTVNFSGLTSFTFNGFAGDDRLIINHPLGGLFNPSGGVHFDGGTGGEDGPGDEMELLGGTADVFEHLPVSAGNGSIRYDGSATDCITYTGLEPIVSTIASFTVRLTHSPTGETITVVSGGPGATTVSSAAAESITFRNPRDLLVIDAGDTGDDTVDVQGLGTGFSADLTIDGQGGTDAVNFQTSATNTGGGNVSVTAERIAVSAAVGTGGGTVTFTATDGVTLSGPDGDVTTATGTFTVDADSDASGVGTYTQDDAGSAVSTSGGTVSIRAADVALTGTIDAGAAPVSFLGSTAGRTFDLGASGGTGQIVLTDGEFDNVTTASRIVVGEADDGAVTFTGAVDMANADTLEIVSGATVNDTGGATAFTDTNLVIDAAQGVGTSSALNIAVSNVEADGGTGGVDLVNTGDLTVGGVSALVGLSATNAVISVTAASSVTVAEAITSAGGDVSLSATEHITLSGGGTDVTTGGGSYTVDADSDDNGTGNYTQSDAGSAVSTEGGTASITAADVVLAGTISGTGTLTIQPSTTSSSIGLGGGAGTLNLTDAELGNLADGFSSITIGDAANGSGTVQLDTVTFQDPVTLAGGTVHDGSGTDLSAPSATFDIEVSPGQSPGILTVDGDVALRAGHSFDVEIDGVAGAGAPGGHDQLRVQGTARTVALDGASLSVTLNAAPAVASQQAYVIVDNADSGSGVSGTFAGLAEGAELIVGSTEFTITYAGGSDSNDVVLTESGEVPEIDVQRPTGFSIADGDIDELGAVPVGTVTLSYTIDNSAGTEQLTIPSAGVTAADLTNCSSFLVDTTLPLAVAAGAAGTLDISFHVDTANSFSLELDIGSNDSDENPYDIRIEGAGTPTPTPEVDGSGTDDVLEITATSQDSGSYVLTTDGVPGPTVNFSGLTSFTFNGFAGDDRLIINHPLGGLFNPSGGVHFDGGTGGEDGPGDEMELLGGTADVFEHLPVSAGNGSIRYDGSATDCITYTGLEPIVSTIASFTVRLTHSPTGETITVVSGGPGATTVSSAAAESITFRNPRDLLVIDAGDTGDDTVDVQGLGTGFSADLTIDGQGGTDAVNFQTSATNTGGGNVSVTAERIAVSAAVGTGGGTVTFTATDGVTLSGLDGDVTTDGGTFTADADSDADGTGTYTQDDAGSAVSSGSGAISIRAADVVLTGRLGGTGTLTILPSPTNTSIGLGGGAGTLNLDDGEIGNLEDGFSSITIGDTANGTGTADIDTVTFRDPVIVAGGSIHDHAGVDLTVPSAVLTGDVAPGQSPGTLAVIGNFTLAADDTFTVEIGGTSPGTASSNHDQLDVTGTVTIGNNVTLGVTAFDGFVPGGGEAFTIVNNDSGDAVTGTFSGLPEGGTVSTNFLGSGLDATISYVGGDGNDVVLTVEDAQVTVAIAAVLVSEGAGAAATTATVSRNTAATGALTVTLSSGDTSEAVVPTSVTIAAGQTTSPAFGIDAIDDAIVDGTQTVTVTATAAGHVAGTDTVDVTDDDVASTLRYSVAGGTPVTLRLNGLDLEIVPSGGGTPLATRPLAGTVTVVINGSTGTDDVLTVSLSPDWAGVSVEFNGGSGGSDSLEIGGGPFTDVTYTVTSQHDGTVDLDGQVIAFTGLEPVTDSSVAANRTFNVGMAGEQRVRLIDSGTSVDGYTRVDSDGTGAFEQVTMRNPTATLTINAGDGDDTLIVTSVDAGFSAAVTLDGETGSADVLSGPNAASGWSITGSDAGTLTAGTTPVINGTFRNVETLRGGSDDDAFAFALGGRMSQQVHGGSGSDTLDYTVFGATVVAKDTENAEGWSGTELNSLGVGFTGIDIFLMTVGVPALSPLGVAFLVVGLGLLACLRRAGRATHSSAGA